MEMMIHAQFVCSCESVLQTSVFFLAFQLTRIPCSLFISFCSGTYNNIRDDR